MTHSEKEVLKLWLDDLDKLVDRCSSTGYLISSGEVQKFMVGMNEIVKALVEKTELLS